RLRATRRAALRAVTDAAQAWGAVDQPDRAARLHGLMGFHGDLGAAGASTTPKAMQWVKDHAGGVRHLEPGTSFVATSDVRVFVLGPPRDVPLLRRSDPSRAHPEVYELAAGS